MKDKCPDLFPKKGMADAIMNLDKYELGSDEELDYSFLSADGKLLWENSRLFKGFMVKHIGKKIEAAKSNVQAPDAERRKRIDELLAVMPENTSLVFAATWFGQLPLGEKVLYLMQKLERFAELCDWQLPIFTYLAKRKRLWSKAAEHLVRFLRPKSPTDCHTKCISRAMTVSV